MTFLQSLLLGVVQGITEFLPVSSSGHLAILRNLLGIDTGFGLLFDVCLHLGTLTAVFIVFRKDIFRMAAETVRMIADIFSNIKIYFRNQKNKDALRYRKIFHTNYRKFTALVLVSVFPTAVLGFAARDLVELSEKSLLVPGICLILTAGLLLIADVSQSGDKLPKKITFTNAFVVGIAQGVSTLPGLSRSGTTITACLLCGFDKRFAVKYSFIMSIPVVVGAAILEIRDVPVSQITPAMTGCCLSGMIAAGAAGYFCIRKMLGIVRKKQFKGFAVYCLMAGILSIAGYIAMS